MHFRKIDIRRMPGFENGGFVLDALSPGINLVYGPNASGKSTTARAIQLLLWPDTMSPLRPSVIGWVDIDNDEWIVELDVNKFHYQCNGIDSESPRGFPGSDVRNRYYLALHELIEDRNLTFAEKIIREAAGGYDVRQAGDSLRFSEKISRPQSLLSELKKVRIELHTARQSQQSLREEENQLKKLKEERYQARTAQERSEWLTKAIDYHEGRLKKHKALDRFQTYPRGMDQLIGDEIKRLEKNKHGRESRREKIQQAKHDIADAQQQLEECQLPEDGVPEHLLGQLRKRANRLQSIQHEIDRLNREIDKSKRLEKDARKRVDPSIDLESLESLDQSALDEFVEFSRKAEMCRAKQLAEGELKQWVGDIEKHSLLQQVQQGVDILVRWLNATEGNGLLDYRWFLLGMMIAGAMLTAGCVLLWLDVPILAPPYTMVLEGVLIFLGLVLFGWIFSAHPNRQKRLDWRKEYEELELEPPETWSIKSVMQKSRLLHKQLAEMNVDQEKAMRWVQLQEKIDNHQQELDSLREERNRLLQKFGLALRFSVEAMPDAHLTHLIANIVNWQRAHDQQNALESERQNAIEQYATCLDAVQQDLSPYSNKTVQTVEEAMAAIDELNSRRESFNEAKGSFRMATQKLKDNQKEMEELKIEYNTLFETVEIQQGDEVTLHEYCRNLDEYLSAKDELKLAEHEERQSYESLTKYPELRERDKDDLNNELVQQQEMAARLDELNNHIGGIRRAIEDAKNKDDIERTLIKDETILEQLRHEREKNYISLVGSLLVNEIEKSNRSSNLPEVFHHAQRIFLKITRGRYRLLLDNQNTPSFRAFDTSLEKGQSLEELSSGTRLQIMMAVRLAFVERQETGLMLPLLMDESLGNSDDIRAQTIIDSVLELCRAGRQIFYFTAQHDEVGKWLYTLQDSGIPHKPIDLAEVRNFLDSERLPQFDLPSPQHYHSPDPGECSHEEYGRLLGAPEFNPWEPIGNMHLWHVIDDPHVLCRLLDRGLNRWGQLQSLGEEYGYQIVADDSRIYKRAVAMSKVFEVLARCLRVGRGKPVDRSALMDSGAVSDRFLDEVSNLTKHQDGDAQKLIQELENQTVAGFRKDKCKDLREFFIDEGFLEERSVMSLDDTRAQINSFLITLPGHELLDQSQLEKMIHRVYKQYMF